MIPPFLQLDLFANAYLPDDPTAQTATGEIHESQSIGVNKLLLQTAPLLFTQTSQDAGSELGYDMAEHSNSVI